MTASGLGNLTHDAAIQPRRLWLIKVDRHILRQVVLAGETHAPEKPGTIPTVIGEYLTKGRCPCVSCFPSARPPPCWR
jgi:hypothetical protein